MITFSTTVSNLLQNPAIETFVLLQIDATYYLSTTYHRNLTMSNGVTYVADGRLSKISPPRISSTVDKEQYIFSLADPSIILGSNVEQDAIGRDVFIRLGFIDPSTKQPLTSINDTLLIYSGVIETANYVVDTNVRGEVLLNVTCSSPMGNLDSKNGIFLSKDFMRTFVNRITTRIIYV